MSPAFLAWLSSFEHRVSTAGTSPSPKGPHNCPIVGCSRAHSPAGPECEQRPWVASSSNSFPQGQPQKVSHASLWCSLVAKWSSAHSGCRPLPAAYGLLRGVSPWIPRATQARARPAMHPHTHSTSPKCHPSSVLMIPLARILISCLGLNTSWNGELTAQLISSWTEEMAQKLPYSGLHAVLLTFLCLQERPGQVW